MNTEQSCLRLSASILSIANTPLFVARELRKHTDVKALANSLRSDDALKRIKKSIAVCPDTLEEEARPYLYLVVLALQGDAGSLNQAAKLNAPNHRWFGKIAQFLLSRVIPTETTSHNFNYSTTYSTSILKSNLPNFKISTGKET